MLLMKVFKVQDALLQSPSLDQELQAINITVIITIGAWVILLELRSRLKYTVWNTTTLPTLVGVSDEYKTYLRAIVRARLLLEESWKAPPLVVRACMHVVLYCIAYSLAHTGASP